MKKKLILVVGVFGLGVASGRLFDAASPRADAGGGALVPACQDPNGDGASNLADAVFYLSWLFRGGAAPDCPTTEPPQPPLFALPATGQETCYDSTGKKIPCDGTDCRGQDGHYQEGCAAENRFIQHDDATVTDTCTGLMWQQDTADVNGNGVIEGESGGADLLEWCEALEYCERLTFANYDDWRLPSIRELESLVIYSRTSPAIEPIFSAVPSTYWSSTTIAPSPEGAWSIHFSEGGTGQQGKRLFGRIRAVRNAR